MIHIRLLGGFHIDVDGRAVDSAVAKSPRGVLLMQYLLLQQGKPLLARHLMRIMWPGDSSVRPESALKTLVNRLRALLREISPHYPIV